MSGEWTQVDGPADGLGDCTLCGCLIEPEESAYVCRVPTPGAPITAAAHGSHFGLLIDHYLRSLEALAGRA